MIADDDELDWAQEALASTQRFAADRGFRVAQLQPKRHRFLRAVPGNRLPPEPERPIARERPKVRKIRELARPDYGKAFDAEYELEFLESGE